MEKPVSKTANKKKLVQTSFFKPIITKEKVIDEEAKQLIELIKGIDFDSLTPVEAMKKLIEIKEKTENND